MMLRDTPFLATHFSGDTAWVDVLFVPRDHRHHGWGRRIFDQWARTLPDTIKKIQLLAVDLDGGSPLGFWTKMGFEVEDADFPELLTGSYMVKPVRDEHVPLPPNQV
jgi:GNAT superfamily N-acetyltransferase